MFYYVTVMNENYAQPSLPAGRGGGHRARHVPAARRERPARAQVRLLGSGTILREVIAAGGAAGARTGTSRSEVWSVTSFTELAREAREVERWNRLHPGDDAARQPRRDDCLRRRRRRSSRRPITCARIRSSSRRTSRAPFIALGTDGFGRSDTRAALRRFFEVDRQHIVVAALTSLVRERRLAPEVVAQAIARYGLDASRPAPWNT